MNDLGLPIEKEGTILLIDQWINQEALDKHHQSKTMQKILDLRKNITCRCKLNVI
ncbi:hypothetical protein SPAR62_0222 [Streptococcus pneumoniae GA40028]|nr:hypothetical protein SPAR62_0270 [Streptococcus pneumoniae GA40028]EHZ40496.1 hypothetical protein SPAR62_0222 [Streptococcus pneumoniae GA40028]